ncbi:MAG: hypothetical protein QOH23_405 [Gaiellaceae bacterium]|nr:hypothetical protein [Gaiellaceae bacterium]
MNSSTVIALGLALASTVLINLAYLREHDAAAALPVLTIRRPVQSVRALLTDRSWLLGFGMETTGFLLYVAALRLASLALVQSVAAGGIGLLAYVSSRVAGRPLRVRERNGVLLSILGLAALGVSLAGGSGEGRNGSTAVITLWLVVIAAAAVSVVTLGRRMLGVAVVEGIAGGLFFSLGDVSTKVATQGGARLVFVLPLILGYTLGTWLLQLGYQRGGALTVAGLATLLTNAVPIAAGTIVLDEPVPSGAYGALRILAFAAVTFGAILLARPERSA